jgi:hypothetical protein
MLSWLLIFMAVAAAVPPPITTTASEEALLGQGEIVIRDHGHGETMGIVDLQAPPNTVLQELLNLKSRVDEVRPIQGIEMVEESKERLVAKWKVGMFGISATFHIWYETDWENGWTQFGVDQTRPHDIDHASGSYQVYPHKTGTRLVYRNDADPGSKLPNWARDLLTSRSMRQQISGIKARAEQR